MDAILAHLVLISIFASCMSQPYPFKGECVEGKYPPKNRPQVPDFVVNLDLPPSDRWNDLVKDKGPQISNLLKTFKDFIRAFGSESKVLIDFIDKDLGFLADSLPEPYGDEVKGIAKASGVPLGEVLLYNIFYEVFTVCTSIVAEDSSGKMYHARNLDFGLFMGWNAKNESWSITEALRPMIVNLDFQRGGKTVFKSVQYAGYVGIITAMKPGVFTLSMNERFNVDGGFIGIFEWIIGMRKDTYWVNLLTRDVMETAKSYHEARDRLANTTIIAPAYYILGGNSSGQGCIITRSRNKALDVWDMGTRNSSWYLLETNYDNWEAPFILDDRRTPGNKCMQKKTQKGMGFAGIFDVLSSVPVLNKLTTYTALMQVNSGKLETYLQYCDDDKKCTPW